MRTSGGTQYRMIYCDMITKIYCKTWKKGEKIPKLETICEQYGCGRNTARTAVKLLEENGYVTPCGKKPPEICFDWENPERRAVYVKELAGRKEAVNDVFQLMVTIMPELFSQIVKETTLEQREEMIELLESCADKIKAGTEHELAQQLIEIYVKALSFLENDTVLHLFYSLYYFVQVPLENASHNLRFRAALLMIQFILKRFQKQVKNQDIESLREQIRILCQSMKTNTENYLNRICRNVTPTERQEYIWITKGDTTYVMLAMDIVARIQDGELQSGQLLPSYAKLAEEAGVSQKTSRNALRLLNEWKVATTVNGVGSRINAWNKKERRLLLKNPTIQENIKIFFEVLQIFIMTCRPVIREYVEDGIRSPVVRAVYKKMSYMLRWGRLLEFCGMEAVEDKEFIYDRKDKMLPEIVYQDAIKYEKIARKFWDNSQQVQDGE